MTGWLLTITLAAAAPLKMAAPGLSATGLPPDRASFLSEYVATQVALNGVKVITGKEISAVLGMERQQELLGCKDSSQCIAEIAAALGTDTVLLGDLALFGGRYVATLKALRSDNGQTVAIQTVEAGNETDFLEALRSAAGRLASDTLVAFGAAPVRLATSGPSRYWAAVPLGLAVVAGSLTPVFFGQATSKYNALESGPPITVMQANNISSDGQQLQTFGVAFTVTAAVMLVAAVVWWFAIGDKP